MQLSLNLYPKLKSPELFDTTYYFEGESFEFNKKGYSVTLRREMNEKTGKLETCAIISGMNFLSDRSGTMFRFLTEESSTYHNNVYLPELNDMTLEDIITFCRHTIENKQKGLYEWSYEYRCSIFTRVAETLDTRIDKKIEAIRSELKAGTKKFKAAMQEIEVLEDKRSDMSGWVFYADAYEKAIGPEKRKEILYRKAGITMN